MNAAEAKTVLRLLAHLEDAHFAELQASETRSAKLGALLASRTSALNSTRATLDRLKSESQEATAALEEERRKSARLERALTDLTAGIPGLLLSPRDSVVVLRHGTPHALAVIVMHETFETVLGLLPAIAAARRHRVDPFRTTRATLPEAVKS